MFVRTTFLVAVASLAAVLLSGCKDTTTVPQNAVVVEEGDQVFIVDRTGKRWDVTLAAEKYGMAPENFQIGLGPFGIEPLIDTPMLTPGTGSYPGDDDFFQILAVKVGDDARAYPISTLHGYEVANDVIGGAHLAVAY